MLDRRIRGESVFRNIFIFPMALSFIVTGVVWQWIFNPSTGVNLLLKEWGLEKLPQWYVDTRVIPGVEWGQISFGIPLALIAVVIAAVWQLSGFAMAMYLAGLRAIPEELREAARVDGANEWQVFRKVVLPQLRPITWSVVIILGHISLKIFDLIYAMTGPGAMFVTDMPGVYMFETTFRGNHYAQGAAIAVIMLLLVSRTDRSLSLEQPAQGGGVMPIVRRVPRFLLYLILLCSFPVLSDTRLRHGGHQLQGDGGGHPRPHVGSALLLRSGKLCDRLREAGPPPAQQPVSDDSGHPFHGPSGIAERICPVQMALPRRRHAVHPAVVRHVHSLPKHPDSA